MTPFERVLEKYRRRGEGRSFDEDLTHHFLCGHVHVSPTYFVMARAVNRFALPSQIMDTAVSFPREDWNAWYVHVLAGNIGDVLGLIPAPGQPLLPFIGWRGLEGLAFQPIDRIARLVPASSNEPV